MASDGSEVSVSHRLRPADVPIRPDLNSAVPLSGPDEPDWNFVVLCAAMRNGGPVAFRAVLMPMISSKTMHRRKCNLHRQVVFPPRLMLRSCASPTRAVICAQLDPSRLADELRIILDKQVNNTCTPVFPKLSCAKLEALLHLAIQLRTFPKPFFDPR